MSMNIDYIVGFLNSRIVQKNVTLQSKRYTAEFLYIQSLDIGPYKTAV